MPPRPAPARPPRASRFPSPNADPDVVQAYLEDASGYPPGRAAGVLRSDDPEEAAFFMRATAGRGIPVLAQAARSSLTGGAVPHGEVVISTERWTSLGGVVPGGARGTVSAGAGVRLRDLQAALADRGWYYPPVPTYQEAMIGGTAATNAGGAATFKYGVTRGWVRGLTVILANGDVLEVERGAHRARPGERFRIVTSGGSALDVPVPEHRLPPLKKISAGYWSEDPLDLVDLFVGSEGTLGVIASVTLDVVPRPAATLTGLAFVTDPGALLALAGSMRDAALAARRRDDPRGPDVRAIESLDARCLDLLRAHGDLRRLRVAVPDAARAALLFEMEAREAMDREAVEDALGSWLEGRAPDGPLPRLFSLLDAAGAMDGLEIAFPGDEARDRALHEFREAVPKRVNEILAARRRTDPAVRKMGGDLVVPFERLGEIVRAYEDGFTRRGLEFAIWGHASDGNLHPNALARNAREMALAEEALREFAERAAALGGAPLSEHGVGRSPLKQDLMRRFVGEAALSRMREIKRALDPEGRLSPGVLFPA